MAAETRLDAHYASAEEELLEGLQLTAAADFRKRAEQALRPNEVQAVLNEALAESAQLLSEKFEEFRADVRLVARLSLGARTFDALHSDAQAEQASIRAAQTRAKRRKWFGSEHVPSVRWRSVWPPNLGRRCACGRRR